MPAPRDGLSGSPDCPRPEAALSSAHTALGLESHHSQGAGEAETKKGALLSAHLHLQPPRPLLGDASWGVPGASRSLPPRNSSFAPRTCLGWALPTVLNAAILCHILISFSGAGAAGRAGSWPLVEAFGDCR